MKFLPVTRSDTSKWRMDSSGIKNKQTKPKESGLDPCSSAEGRKHSKCHWFRMDMVLGSTSDSYTLLVPVLPKPFSQDPLPEHPKTWHQLGTKSSNTWDYMRYSHPNHHLSPRPYLAAKSCPISTSYNPK